MASELVQSRPLSLLPEDPDSWTELGADGEPGDLIDQDIQNEWDLYRGLGGLTPVGSLVLRS